MTAVTTVAPPLGGWWATCSGCAEFGEMLSFEHLYPLDPDYGCRLGDGCDECDDIGAVVQYGPGDDEIDALRRDLAGDQPAPPAEGDHVPSNGQTAPDADVSPSRLGDGLTGGER